MIQRARDIAPLGASGAGPLGPQVAARWDTRRAGARLVLRECGAASIFMGRTPHEVRDELCRAIAR